MEGCSSFKLSKAELAALVTFQKYLCNSVYRLKLSESTEFKNSPYLLVPLSRKEGYIEIDWDLVNLAPMEGTDERILAKPDEGARQNLPFSSAQYEDKVIVPWYKNDEKPEVLCEKIVVLVELSEPFLFTFVVAILSSYYVRCVSYQRKTL